jgi:phosphatidylserine/phosphatidylglycerophosphate/cardiolipin synthase-like enzyme
MPTKTLSGKVLDKTGSPFINLKVILYVDLLYESEVGIATTSSSGDFLITYNTPVLGGMFVRVFDEVRRELYESPLYADIADPVSGLPLPITLARSDVDGWLVTERTGTPQRLSTGNTVTPIVDNAAAWKELTTAIQIATGTARFLIHYFDVERLIASFDLPYEPPAGQLYPIGFVGTPAIGKRLEVEILAANRPPRSAWVWIVINEFPLPLVDTATHLERYLIRQNLISPHTVKLARFKVPQATPMHAKVVVVGDPSGFRALIPASGLIQEYFDGPAHIIDDPRRGRYNYTNVIKLPVHDVSVTIRGGAVNHMDETIRLHWDHLNPTSPIPAIPPAAAPSPGVGSAVQIVRTLPANVFSSIPTRGETGILEAYQRAFFHASDFIYLENQYVTESLIGSSLYLAMARNTTLQVIILINIDVDVPFYIGMQIGLIKRLQQELDKIGAGNRLGVFTLWTHEKALAPGGGTDDRILANYVHSKVATIGSANMEGTGLNRAQHISPFPPFVLKISRGMEVNAVVYNGVAGQPASTVPDQLRRTLWAEHLGYHNASGQIDPSAGELVTRPAGSAGWLKRWIDRANAKVAALKSSPPALHPCRVLPWRPEKDPDDYLSALGIDVSKLKVLDQAPEFIFGTGQWK